VHKAEVYRKTSYDYLDDTPAMIYIQRVVQLISKEEGETCIRILKSNIEDNDRLEDRIVGRLTSLGFTVEDDLEDAAFPAIILDWSRSGKKDEGRKRRR
jgi:hypothetical protein